MCKQHPWFTYQAVVQAVAIKAESERDDFVCKASLNVVSIVKPYYATPGKSSGISHCVSPVVVL